MCRTAKLAAHDRSGQNRSALVEHKISASPPILPQSDQGVFATPWSRLLPRNAGGIVCRMPLSRQPMPDLFGAVADHEPHHGPARLTSIRPTPAVMSTADKSSPRYVLPKDLSNALQQLDDLELDRLVAASRHELRRRGRPVTSAPEIRPTTHISPGERTSKHQSQRTHCLNVSNYRNPKAR